MVFKRQPKKRDPAAFAERALKKVQEQDEEKQLAQAAYEEGRRLEEEGDDEAALQAHQESVLAWERYHQVTSHGVGHEPYERIAILLRRYKQPHAEVEVLERYIAAAGRDPHPKLVARLERAQQLAWEAEQAEEEEL